MSLIHVSSALCLAISFTDRMSVRIESVVSENFKCMWRHGGHGVQYPMVSNSQTGCDMILRNDLQS